MTWRPLPAQLTDREEVETGTPVARSLETLVRRMGIAAPATFNAVAGLWSEAVGPEIAQRSAPHSMVDGVLIVEAVDPAWVTQLRWLAPSVIGRVNEALRQEVVRALQVRQVKPGRSKPTSPE